MKKIKLKEHQSTTSNLFTDIKTLIQQSKHEVAVYVNSAMTMLYWRIGKRIVLETSGKGRSETYGQEVILNLCRNLSQEFGGTFSEKNVRRMMQFYNTFPDEKIVVSLIRKLSWTHILAVIPIDDPLKREFYIEMCSIERWSVRTFRERINSMLYERTAISRKPEETIKHDLELLRLENSNIKVADYLTQLPEKHLLEQRLRTAIELARQKLEQNT